MNKKALGFFELGSNYSLRALELFSRKLAILLPLLIFDKIYYSAKYQRIFQKRLNLNNPQSFNEKIQWLKTYDRKPLYTQLADKYAVRDFVKDKIGNKYLNELIGVWDSVDEINFEKLPEKFVLKATHGCGWHVICPNKAIFDPIITKSKIEKWLKLNWYNLKGEYHYKNITPRIVCEKYLEDENNEIPVDYKFYCFNGYPKYVEAVAGRYNNRTEGYFDIDWNLQPFHRNYPVLKNNLMKPSQLELMGELASILSNDMDFCRVDFYNYLGKVIFGEITLFPYSGFHPFIPNNYDYIIGSLLLLRKK